MGKSSTLYFTFFLMGFLIITGLASAQNCNCDHVVTPYMDFINADTIGWNVKPGDTVCVMATAQKRHHLKFKNFRGAPGNPVVFINCGGRVHIGNDDFYYALDFENCKYFHLTGTGPVGSEESRQDGKSFGFFIDGAGGWGKERYELTSIGVNIGVKSTDFEIDHVEVTKAQFAAIMAKTDPDCQTAPQSFVQRNTVIHDNYIHDTYAEGIYVGFPNFKPGKRVACSANPNDSITVLPHLLEGVKIYNNEVVKTQREGIQVGCAISDVEIFNNFIEDYGLRNVGGQRSGIHISSGTTGRCYNNNIKNGKGMGIFLNGKGDNYIYNNFIVYPGEDGIEVRDSLVDEGKGFYILNNTIIYPGEHGIRMRNVFSKGNKFFNNIVIGPRELYAQVQNPAEWEEANNYYSRDIRTARFKSYRKGDYHLTETSPCVDGGRDATEHNVIDDYEANERPRGREYDIGAFESEYERRPSDFIVYPNPFLDTTSIYFVVYDEEEIISLDIFDGVGKHMDRLIAPGTMEAQSYKIQYIPYSWAGGVYYCRLRRGSLIETRKMVLLR